MSSIRDNYLQLRRGVFPDQLCAHVVTLRTSGASRSPHRAWVSRGHGSRIGRRRISAIRCWSIEQECARVWWISIRVTCRRSRKGCLVFTKVHHLEGICLSRPMIGTSDSFVRQSALSHSYITRMPHRIQNSGLTCLQTRIFAHSSIYFSLL